MSCAPRRDSTTRAFPDSTSPASRSTNGSIGQTIFRNSNASPFLGPPPPYNSLLPAPAGAPFRPDIFVMDKDFENPRTFSASIGYDKEIFNHLAASVAYTYAATDNLTRFINRNDAVFGSPWTHRTRRHDQRSRRSHHRRELGEITLQRRHLQPRQTG